MHHLLCFNADLPTATTEGTSRGRSRSAEGETTVKEIAALRGAARSTVGRGGAEE